MVEKLATGWLAARDGDEVTVRLGLPAEFVRRAAEVTYDAFREKYDPLMGDREHTVAVLTKDFDRQRAIVALYRGEFAGLAGFYFRKRHFHRLRLRTFVEVYGWPVGVCRYLLSSIYQRPQRAGELLMDGIVVRGDLRGKRIGTRLLEGIFAFARRHGFRTVRLDVVDTNPDARRLYERMGFVATASWKLACLRRLIGFSGATTMVKTLDQRGKV
jgi:GNAT superfamily N-acetyltransferase